MAVSTKQQKRVTEQAVRGAELDDSEVEDTMSTKRLVAVKQELTRSPSRSRSRSPSGKAKFYGCRANVGIVGHVGKGGAHGVHTSWDSVEAFAWEHPNDSIRAAMMDNYKKFSTEEEALEYCETSPTLFPHHVKSRWKKVAKFVGVVLLLGVLGLIMRVGCIWYQCYTITSIWRTSTICNACTEGDKLLKDHQLALYGAAGTAMTTALAGVVNIAFEQF